jgi:hypothetical protein
LLQVALGRAWVTAAASLQLVQLVQDVGVVAI